MPNYTIKTKYTAFKTYTMFAENEDEAAVVAISGECDAYSEITKSQEEVLEVTPAWTPGFQG